MKVKYTVWVNCLGGDEQLMNYPEPDGCGFDDTIEGAEPKWFNTLKDAREYCEYDDEYIMDSGGTYHGCGIKES